MSLADNLTSVYKMLTLQEALEGKRRKLDSEASIRDLYASGREVDSGSIRELLASGADPASVASIAKIYQGEELAEERALDLKSRRTARDAPGRSGALKMGMQQWHSLPQDQQTFANWRGSYLPVRSALIKNGIFEPDELPEDAGPQDIDTLVGFGYSPAQQDFTQYREDEAGARQGRFETSEAAKQQRFGQSQAGIESRAAASRSAADARSARSGEGGAGGVIGRAPSGYRWKEDGSLEPIPGGPATVERGGFEMSYDAEGRPVVSMGGRNKPFTESQSKSLPNVTLAEGANRDMDALAEEGFDPSSMTGAAGITMAQTPGLNVMAPEKAQRQNAANIAFVQSVNYQRSGAASTEPEYNRAVQSTLPKLGDKPETAAAKRKYRTALVEAVKSQDGRIDVIVDRILKGAGGGTPSRSAQGVPAGQQGTIRPLRDNKGQEDDPNRPLTPEEMAEYMALKGGRR